MFFNFLTKFHSLVPSMIYPNKKNPIPEKITIRKPLSQITEQVPIHWLDGNIVKTHVVNALSIIFKNEEEYFIKIVRKFIPKLKNTKLKKEIISFIGQEQQHCEFHSDFCNKLKDQGFDFQFLSFYIKNFVYGSMEAFLSDELNLAIASGLEHYNKSTAELSLREKVFSNSDVILKELFEWHLAEELEHSNVVFDLLREIDSNYLLRMQGFLIASLVRNLTLTLATTNLIVQDDLRQFLRIWKEGKDFFFTKDQILYKFFLFIVDYAKPDFHPSQHNMTDIISEIFKNRNFEIFFSKKPANQTEQTVN